MDEPQGGDLTAASFTPHVGRTFRVRGGRHAFELAEVQVGAAQEGWPRQLFNVIFHGAKDDVLPEGLYVLDSDGGEAFELYLIPVHTPAPGRQDYQAAFN